MLYDRNVLKQIMIQGTPLSETTALEIIGRYEVAMKKRECEEIRERMINLNKELEQLKSREEEIDKRQDELRDECYHIEISKDSCCLYCGRHQVPTPRINK